jgi:tetratricopeptide (TPR) repeat protein
MSNSSKKNDITKKAPSEIINPLSIRKAGRGHDGQQAGHHRHFTVLSFSLFLVAVIAIGGWFFTYLKSDQMIADPTTSPDVAERERGVDQPTSMPVGRKISSSPEKDTQTGQKNQAEGQRLAYFQVKSTLEKMGVSSWGENHYEEMVIIEQEAETLFSQHAFDASSALFITALEKANLLINGAQTALIQLNEKGDEAIAKGDGQKAREAFQTALLIDPSNAIARSGFKRAQNIETVKRFIEKGMVNEREGNYTLALNEYSQALALDPKAEKALTGRNRVEAIIEEAQFQQLMSDGQAALAQKDLQKARSQLLKAKSLRPEDAGVIDALAETDQAIHMRQIEIHHQAAIQAEKDERWSQALTFYQKVLQLDKNIRFAVQGEARAQDYIRINKRISYFLEKPSALESDRQLQNALSLIDETERLAAKGPRLNERINELKTIVETAKTPVRLIIESDNQTDVAVYKVGKFGRFTERELVLRPGTYTVVGSREGYQDVRKKFKVIPGQQPQRITIICTVEV